MHPDGRAPRRAAGRHRGLRQRRTGWRRAGRLAPLPGRPRRTRSRLDVILAAESECCAFLDFRVRASGRELLLTISAPEGGELVANELSAAFRGVRGWPGCVRIAWLALACLLLLLAAAHAQAYGDADEGGGERGRLATSPSGRLLWRGRPCSSGAGCCEARHARSARPGSAAIRIRRPERPGLCAGGVGRRSSVSSGSRTSRPRPPSWAGTGASCSCSRRYASRPAPAPPTGSRQDAARRSSTRRRAPCLPVRPCAAPPSCVCARPRAPLQQPRGCPGRRDGLRDPGGAALGHPSGRQRGRPLVDLRQGFIAGSGLLEHRLLGYMDTPNRGNACWRRTERPVGAWRYLVMIGLDFGIGLRSPMPDGFRSRWPRRTSPPAGSNGSAASSERA